jgi:hypothetical protein
MVAEARSMKLRKNMSLTYEESRIESVAQWIGKNRLKISPCNPLDGKPVELDPAPCFPPEAHRDPLKFSQWAVSAFFVVNHYITGTRSHISSLIPDRRLQTKAEDLLGAANRAWFEIWIDTRLVEPMMPQPGEMRGIEWLRCWCRFRYELLKNLRFAKSCWDCFLGKDELGAGDVLLLAFPLMCGTVPGDLSEWQREVAQFSKRLASEKEMREQEKSCSRRIVEWAWDSMRQVHGCERPIIPMKIQNGEDAERAMDMVVQWCDRQTPSKRTDWTCTAAGFYFGGDLKPLNQGPLRLLEAFLRAEDHCLTSVEILQASTEFGTERKSEAYVHDLNKRLRDMLNLSEPPIKRIHVGVYQFVPLAR